MHSSYLGLALVLIVLLAAAIAVVALAGSNRSRRRRVEDLRARHLARQPWDARAAEGRGNR